MTKQEEIREGMRSHLKRFYIRCFGEEPDDVATDYLEHCLKNQEMWLASQGIVIKVDGELPHTAIDNQYLGKIWIVSEKEAAGYGAFEPLLQIKEE